MSVAKNVYTSSNTVEISKSHTEEGVAIITDLMNQVYEARKTGKIPDVSTIIGNEETLRYFENYLKWNIGRRNILKMHYIDYKIDLKYVSSNQNEFTLSGSSKYFEEGCRNELGEGGMDIRFTAMFKEDKFYIDEIYSLDGNYDDFKQLVSIETPQNNPNTSIEDYNKLEIKVDNLLENSEYLMKFEEDSNVYWHNYGTYLLLINIFFVKNLI